MSFPQLSEIKVGDVLVADGGFTCLTDGERVTVEQDNGGLFVLCAGPDEGENVEADYGVPATRLRCNQHYLDGQGGEAGECVGFWKA